MLLNVFVYLSFCTHSTRLVSLLLGGNCTVLQLFVNIIINEWQWNTMHNSLKPCAETSSGVPFGSKHCHHPHSLLGWGAPVIPNHSTVHRTEQPSAPEPPQAENHTTQPVYTSTNRELNIWGHPWYIRERIAKTCPQLFVWCTVFLLFLTWFSFIQFYTFWMYV